MYGVKDGLSQNSVHAVFRDHDGLVWIGTQDGLNSFDGKDFVIYRQSEGDSTTISDQFILEIQEDKDGNIWVGTRNGLNCLNKHTQKFRRYYIDPKEQHEFQASYKNLFLTNDGKACVLRNGLVVIDIASGKAEQQSGPVPQCNWFITASGHLWLIDPRNRLFYSENIGDKKFTMIGAAPAELTRNYNAMRAIASGDSLLFFYDINKTDSLFVFDTKRIAVINKIALPPGFVQLSVNDANDIVAAYAAGMYFTGISKAGKFIKCGQENAAGLPPGAVLTTYKDREGNLWAGTSGNGLAVSNSSFNNYRIIKPPVPGDVITAAAKNSNGIYIGTRSGLYLVKDPGDISSSKIRLILRGNITAAAADAHENIWAAVQGKGISILDKNNKRSQNIIPRNDAGATVMNLESNSTNGMMISTTAGFFIAPSPIAPLISFGTAEADRTLCGNYVMGSFTDRDGNIWIADNKGIDVFDRALQRKLFFSSWDDRSSPIKRTIITSVAQDANGAMWIGTIRNGLYKFFGGNFTHYTVSSGLTSDVIYNVIRDSRQRLWVTTSVGLNVFNERTNSFITLTPGDGVPAAEYIFGAAMRESNELYFGTSEGLLICRTDKTVFHETSMNAYVANIKVNGQSVSTSNSNFEIMPDDKVISFELAVSPAFFSGNIIYQYRLLGQQDEWITLPPGIHTVNYTGLRYNELSMQVRAAGSLNNLLKAPINTVIIKSKAPFWKTTAFILALVLILAALVTLAVADYNRRNYKKKLQELKIEKGLQAERIRIGRDLHDNIGAYTSALIAGLNHIKSMNTEQEKQVDNLKDYGASIMGFLRETIWMLNTEILTITAFADRFKNYALRISNNYPGIDFRFSDAVINDKSLLPSMMLNLFRILQEALQNACKHSGATIITFIVKSDDLLYFEVRDNGKGFGEIKHTEHYGLNNMKERAAEAGFTLTAESTANGVVIALLENTANAALQANVKKSNLQ